MINFIIGAILSSVILITFYFTLFKKKKIINYKNRDHLHRLISQNDFEFLLIDIRQEEEFEKYHIPTAVNIPYEKLISSLPVENMFLTIIVYGDRKNKSYKAGEYLSDQGYFNVTSFGSLSRWKGELITKDIIGDKHIENSRKGRVNFPV